MSLKKGKEAWDKVQAALEKMGYTGLRQAQRDCLIPILNGEDTFIVIPTGGGKTLLAAIPALVMEAAVVIFSPLVALMTDQAQQLNKRRVRAGFISSAHTEDQNAIELSDWLDGRTQVLLVAPERLESNSFMAAMRSRKPDLIVLDEAHCLSQWSSTFRPNYAKVGGFIRDISPEVVIAMTATATKEIYEDVEETLGREMRLERHYTPRENLQLSSRRAYNFEEVVSRVASIIKRDPEASTIIYCASVNHVTTMAAELSNNYGIETCYYHGQIKDASEKAMMQDAFMSGRVKVIAATNAFGMGIDKPDIRRIIHADLPLSLEALSQEIGRAGRDGKAAECILFDTDEGRRLQDLLWESSNPSSRLAAALLRLIIRNADTSGVCRLSVEDMVVYLGGDRSVNGALAFFTSLGVIERRQAEQLAEIKLIDKEVKVTPTQARVLEEVDRLGVKTQSGVYKIPLEVLASAVGTTKSGVRTHLTGLQKKGVIDFKPPSRVKETVLTGKKVYEEDLKFLDDRRSDEEKKLNLVRKYAKAADDEKQTFLMNYFHQSW